MESTGVVGLEVGVEAADADAGAAVVVVESEGAEADETDIEGGDGDVAGLESRLHEVLGMRELQAGVRKNIEEEAVALSEDDADTVVGEGLDAVDLAEVTLEVGGSAHFAVDLVAVEGEVEPELDVPAVKGVPSCQKTSLRRVKVHSVKAGLTVHVAARYGQAM